MCNKNRESVSIDAVLNDFYWGCQETVFRSSHHFPDQLNIMPRRSQRRAQYQSASIADPRLADAGVTRGAMLFGPAHLDIPAVTFGDTDPTSVALLKPADAAEWPAKTMFLPEVYRFWIRDAVVHPPFGIVTIGGFAVAETLGHIPFHLEGYARDGNAVTLPETEIEASFANGIHVMGGNYKNHFHFLTDIIPKLQIEPFVDFNFDGPVLLPPFVNVPITEIATRLSLVGRPAFAPGTRAAQVRNLLFSQNLFGWGYAPNPHLNTFFSNLKKFLDVDEAAANKIYITRRDSKTRVMTNEYDVIATVQAFGYQVVELSGMGLSAQARLFAGASHIVAPHGAGLANLVFCDPGATVCELHMNTYLNWCYRRLAGLRRLKYGCLVGTPEAEDRPAWVHNSRWSVPISRLEAVLAAI